MPSRDDDLRAEILALLASAAQLEIDHAEAIRLSAEAHQSEIDELVDSARRLAAVHSREAAQREAAHAELVANLKRAVESRDLIGQAKGVLIVSMRCTTEHAFAVMVKQSQHENRKLGEIAAEIVERAQRRAFVRKSADNATPTGAEPQATEGSD